MAWRLRKRITVAVREKNLLRLMTLTLDPKKQEASGAKPRVIWDVWRKFRVYLGRRLGKGLAYVAVLELQKSGMPHLHVLLDGFIEQAWISETWSKLGGGRMVDIRRVRSSEGAARYLVKYLGKGLASERLRGVRRYSCSRNIRLQGEKDGKTWKPVKRAIEGLMHEAGDKVLETIEDREGRVTFFTVKKPILWGLRWR